MRAELMLLYATMSPQEFALEVLPAPLCDYVRDWPGRLHDKFLTRHMSQIQKLAEEPAERSARLRLPRERAWDYVPDLRIAFEKALYVE